MQKQIKLSILVVLSLSFGGCASTSVHTFIGDVFDGAGNNMDSRDKRLIQSGRSAEANQVESVDLISGVLHASVKSLVRSNKVQTKPSNICVNGCSIK